MRPPKLPKLSPQPPTHSPSLAFFTETEAQLVRAVIRGEMTGYNRGTTTWNALEKMDCALSHPGPVTISALNAPGSASASTESDGSSAPEEDILLALLTKLEKSFDSSSLSLRKGSAQWNYSYEAKPLTAATDSGPPKDGHAWFWSTVRNKWARADGFQ